MPRLRKKDLDIGTFADMFKAARGTDELPFPYQERLAHAARWPDVLRAPTGLGKTAAVILAWAWARLQHPERTPRRLVYCLPMRTLVTQTVECAKQWLKELKKFEGRSGGKLPAKVHTLMGGIDKESEDRDWIDHPENPAILIGTQDMLISRALMRGYGISRFRWPVDFALLQWDAQWVFDEVQLMGASLPTSTQLEAFRRGFERHSEQFISLPPSRSLWISATLDPGWLKTIDFEQEIEEPVVWQWNDSVPGKRASAPEPEPLKKRLDAQKGIRKAKISLTGKKDEDGKYAKRLAEAILRAHRSGKTTLVILNTVQRAQELYKVLRGDKRCILLHSRFRAADRKKQESQLPVAEQHKDMIIISTQAVEAGVDLTSAVLFTELAPWASLVQRFGRCNRFGELDSEEAAQIYWIDIESDDTGISGPYEATDLQTARKRLRKLRNAAPRELNHPGEREEPRHVLRRKDLLELFDTDPDLTGYDLDISSYIRDEEDTDLQIFWRDLKDEKGKDILDSVRTQAMPEQDELCAIPIGQARLFFKLISKLKRKSAFIIDPNLIKEKTVVPWVFLTDEVRPGMLVMLDEGAGGYDKDMGFDRQIKAGKVKELPKAEKHNGKSNVGDSHITNADQDSELGVYVGLPQHLCHVHKEAQGLCKSLGVLAPFQKSVCDAALWHDVGKAHTAFQALLTRSDAPRSKPRSKDLLLAKAPRIKKEEAKEEKKGKNERPGFRHELASALAYLSYHNKTGSASADLIAYLIAAHHGKVRMGIRARGNEKRKEGIRFARGVWEGDKLPALIFGKESIEETTLSLEIMEMGEGTSGPRGTSGPSWSARTQGLLNEHGPFRLALLETLVRIADWRASNKEAERKQDDV